MQTHIYLLTKIRQLLRKGINSLSRIQNRALFFLVSLLASPACFASTDRFGFDGPLQQIISALTGNVVTLIATLAVVICGIALSVVHDLNGTLKRFLQIVIGAGIAIAAPGFIVILFPSAAGALV